MNTCDFGLVSDKLLRYFEIMRFVLLSDFVIDFLLLYIIVAAHVILCVLVTSKCGLQLRLFCCALSPAINGGTRCLLLN